MLLAAARRAAARAVRARAGWGRVRASRPFARRASPSAPSRAPSSIEETYQKKTQREHILLRPEPYVGAVEVATGEAWTLNRRSKKVELREVSASPGLLHIVDEALVNALDNASRLPSMREIDVRVDAELGQVSVYNDGAGIPCDTHKKERMMVPELIFGHLLTSSNYDDSKRRFTGGRNGMGSKLTNLFSTSFVVEVYDAHRRRRFRQVYLDNMLHRTEPQLAEGDGAAAPGALPADAAGPVRAPSGGTPSGEPFDAAALQARADLAVRNLPPLPAAAGGTDGSDNWTRVTFCPDFARFGCAGLDRDALSMLHRRVYDAAACVASSGAAVSLNGAPVRVRSFEDYIALYPAVESHVYAQAGRHWQVAVGRLSGGAGQPPAALASVSFVNGISTPRGGTHVALVADQVARFAAEQVNRRHKDLNVLPGHVRGQLFLFVNATVENPSFDTQTKDALTTPASRMGTEPRLPRDFLRRVLEETGLEDALVRHARARQNRELARTSRSQKSVRRLGIPKLDDANWAGGARSKECTLILTEGDSAKALAVSGLEVIGRDRFGVFPLRGKMLNVRDASHKQILGNAEIKNLCLILGLEFGRRYRSPESRARLRYGRVMLMTDQDNDGSHIKGLFLNMMHHFWPELLESGDFVEEFVTAIIRARHRRTGELRTFYYVPEFREWCAGVGEAEVRRSWSVKYYKGLGTSTAAEGRAYFRDLDKQRVRFQWRSEAEDGASLVKAFSKAEAQARKDWLQRFVADRYLDHSSGAVTVRDFIDDELVQFSYADNVRSIPSAVDGLKPGQRKILYACFRRRLREEIKVAQLAGYVSEHTGYHHGEASLHGTIINMAQTHVGSGNNAPLLHPGGQFGTRHVGGKDAASPRYVFTRLEPLARLLFPEEDDALLRHVDEDGETVEPEWFVPVIPLALVNGADGVGTGFSTQVPRFNPRDVVANVRRLLRGERPQAMVPWARGFQGQVTVDEEAGAFTTRGVARRLTPTLLEISELPIGRWTQDYKEILNGMMDSSPPAGLPSVRSYTEHHTTDRVRFEVHMTREDMRVAEDAGFYNAFRLVSKGSLRNMHLFSRDGVITKYGSPLEILEAHFPVRMHFYERRREHLIEGAEAELQALRLRRFFLEAVIAGRLPLYRRAQGEVERDFAALLEAEGGALAERGAGDVGALMQQPVSAFTEERLGSLARSIEAREGRLAGLLSTTAADMWSRELDALDEAFAELDRKDEELNRPDTKAAAGAAPGARAKKKGGAGGAGGGRPRAKKAPRKAAAASPRK